MKKNWIVGLLIFCLACDSKDYSEKKAGRVIDEAVKAHGGDAYEDLEVTFKFRQYTYTLINTPDLQVYARTFQDSSGSTITDEIRNGIFERKQDGQKVVLTDKEELKFREAVNSVAYFMLVPYKLKDKAVNHIWLEEAIIEGKSYDKIKIWFDEEGGGNDFEDVFTYWVNKQTHLVDYLAYSNGGPRFRKAIGRDTIDNVIFQNYENYKIMDTTALTNTYDKLFLTGKAELLYMIQQGDYKTLKR